MSLEKTVGSARAAWLCHTTSSDVRWRLKQLHGLYNFLSEKRDEVIARLAKDNASSAFTWELELAISMKDLAKHIELLSSPPAALESRTASGRVTVSAQPLGVSLILVDANSNPLRYALAPFIASIAAGNTVILATVQDPARGAQFLSFFQSNFSKYLDGFALFSLPVSQAELSSSSFDGIDNIAIFADDFRKYESILALPKALFFDTACRLNLAVIDQGKNIDKVAGQILDASGIHVPKSEALTAVFVREENFSSFADALGQAPESGAWPEKADLGMLQSLELKAMGTNMLQWDPTASEKADTIPHVALGNILDSVVASNAFLVIKYRSLDQAIDLINRLEGRVQKVALFTPESSKMQRYFTEWISCPVVSIGSMGTLSPISVVGDFVSNVTAVGPTIYSTKTFSSQTAVILSGDIVFLRDITAIRNSYKNLIQPLKPESRGERVDFFVQVGWVVKGVKLVIGAGTLVSLLIGGKMLKRRFY